MEQTIERDDNRKLPNYNYSHEKNNFIMAMK